MLLIGRRLRSGAEEKSGDTTLYENAMSQSAAADSPASGEGQTSGQSRPTQPEGEQSSMPEGISPVEGGASGPQTESNAAPGEKATELVS